MNKYVCIDIGGTVIKYGIINEDGNILVKGERKSESYKGGIGLLEKVKEITNNYKQEYEISGICISTAGMVDPFKGEIIYASSAIPNYIGTKIKEEIEKEFNIQCEVENDVNCAGMGEVWKGAGRGTSSCVCLTVGTGIGGSIILGNKIFHGYNNSAGEIGYMNMNGGTFQELAAASSLVRRVAERKNIKIEEIDGKKIFELAKSGDIDCIEEIDYLIEILTLGMANIIYMINPEVIILGGGIMAQKEYLNDKIDKALKDKLIDRLYSSTKIKFAENENNAGMLGALYNFLQRRR